ncbi:glycosyltransferase 87 family protein [Kineococcus terrestris]|uniref:glycosyltransferase 87 family protein n=1 Tax=Kineococcus terrestris TaxID=2044856 RepID=UPI0034DB034E
MSTLDRLLRLRHVLVGLSAVGVVLSYLTVFGTPDDWWYFRDAAVVLAGRDPAVSPGAFYRTHPGTWIGPVPLLLWTPLALLPEAVGGWTVALLSAAAVPCATLLAESLSTARWGPSRRARLTVLLAGCAAAPVWTEVCTTYTHPEDVAVVLLFLGALHALHRRRPVLTGLLLGLAAGGKPWAVGLLPLVVVLPTRAGRGRAAVSALLAAALPWVPFLSVPGTLAAVSGSWAVVFAETPLGVAGLAGQVYPTTARLSQFALAVLLVAAVVRRHRWSAALFCCVAARLALEPQVLDYHWASLVLGAVVADVVGRRPLPLLSGLVVLTYHVSRSVDVALVEAGAQLVPLAAALALVLHRGRAEDGPGGPGVPAPRSGADLGVRGLQHGGVGPLQPRRAADAVEDHEPQERPA